MATKTLTSKQAAKLLGVKEATLYAYVSRGMIRSVEATDGDPRTRQYRAEDVQKLLKRKRHRRDPARAAEEALRWGEPVMTSALTRIEDGRLYYRGRDAAELALSATFEEVAALLWSIDTKKMSQIVEIPTQSSPAPDTLAMLALRAVRAAKPQTEAGPAASLWDALRAGRLGGLEFRMQYAVEDGQPLTEFVCDDARLIVRVRDDQPDGALYTINFGGGPYRLLIVSPARVTDNLYKALLAIVDAAADIVPLSAASRPASVDGPALPTLAALQTEVALAASGDPRAYDTSAEGVAAAGARILRLIADSLTGGVPGRIADGLSAAFGAPARVFDAALIVIADHELNASSFTARVVASTGAHPYAVVAAAMAALSGPRHGGAVLRACALLDEAAALDTPDSAVTSRVRRGEPIPGFGHPLYPDADPRCAVLMNVIGRFAGESARFELCRSVMSAGTAATGLAPNIDFALATLVHMLDLPAEAGPVLFALGRTAGWIAHAIEQYADGRLIRPRAKYVGDDVPQSPAEDMAI